MSVDKAREIEGTLFSGSDDPLDVDVNDIKGACISTKNACRKVE